MTTRQQKIDQIRQLAEEDLYTFAKLVNPSRLYGDIHKEVFKWLENMETPNQLLLLPRAHMKSHCIAVWCAWWITKHPETTMLYLSATSTLAEAQLYAIKALFESKVYRKYWPDMIHPDEGKREKWTASQIAVDHPKRKREGVRDMTVIAAGLTTNTTGLHADVIVPDDVVVPDNAYTEEGRRKCSAAMSQMASILNTGGIIKACGTRYHPADQYSIWKEQKVFEYDDNDDICGEKPIWDIKEHVVEEDGVFLWPRAVRPDGKPFGFDRKELARIKALYTDRTQFYAQYYNNPNDPESARISRDKFQYYDKKFIANQSGQWYYKGQPLNVYAAIDFAFSLNKKADYTAIVVVGIAPDGHVYVLDIDRFRTDKISVYFEHIVALHSQWDFKKLRAEVTTAQSIIARDLKDRIRQEGLRLSVEEYRPTRHQGNKEERIAAALEHRYDNLSVWHFKGGYTPVLEEELVQARPAHDDLKDCLASVVEIAVPPRKARRDRQNTNKVTFNSRFGGIAH